MYQPRSEAKYQTHFLLKLGIHTRFHFDDNFVIIVVIVTQGIECHVDDFVFTLISPSIIAGRFIVGTIESLLPVFQGLF